MKFFLCLLASLPVSVVQAQSLGNGSFETGDFSGGWVTTPAVGANVEVTLNSVTATDGVHGVAFNRSDTTPNATLSQDVLLPGAGTYRLRFDHAVLTSVGSNQGLLVQVSETSAGDLLSTVISDPDPGSSTTLTFEEYAFEFDVGAATTVTIAFVDQPGNPTVSTDTRIDDVRLHRVVGAPTLSDAGAVALAAGLALVGALAARRGAPRPAAL